LQGTEDFPGKEGDLGIIVRGDAKVAVAYETLAGDGLDLRNVDGGVSTWTVLRPAKVVVAGRDENGMMVTRYSFMAFYACNSCQAATASAKPADRTLSSSDRPACAANSSTRCCARTR
jgi:hypothetical protein